MLYRSERCGGTVLLASSDFGLGTMLHSAINMKKTTAISPINLIGGGTANVVPCEWYLVSERLFGAQDRNPAEEERTG